MALKHIHFFDKNGNNITPKFESGIYKLNINFNSVSAGLFETEQLFIFEEVYKTYDPNTINLDQVQKPIAESTLIRFLTRLNSYSYPLTWKKIQDIFIVDQLTVNEVDEFAIKNQNYIQRIHNGAETTYALTEDGLTYLENYRETEQDLNLINSGLKVEYTKPRANFNAEVGEDTYFVYQWKEPETDKNIFSYLIDKTDNTTYYRENKSTCLNEGEHFYNFVPVYDEYLKIDSVTNPNWKNLFLPYRFDQGNNDTFISNDYNEKRILKIDQDLNYDPMQFNFALNSETEGFFQRTLEIFFVRQTQTSVSQIESDYHANELVTNIYKFAEITFQGEVIAEDERFRLLLENFDRKIDEKEVYVFRESDIEEDKPDYKLLNVKRKELLLEGDSIYSNLGNYKSFINAIKFFGYHDLTLKEYFYNIELSDPLQEKIYYSAIDVPLTLENQIEYKEGKTFNELKYKNLHKSDQWKKTSRFGLVYKINKLTGEYDEDGKPVTEDALEFTPEEVLIKIYGLKKVLEKYFLPHNVRIINITGEGIYFALYTINTWQDVTPIIRLTYDKNPDFEATPLKGYLKPLDRLINIYRLKDNINIQKITRDTVLKDIINKCMWEFDNNSPVNFPFQDEMPFENIQKYYDDYYSIKDDINIHLKQSFCNTDYNSDVSSNDYARNKLLGQPVELKLKSFQITWDDLDGVTWFDLDSISPKCIIRGPKPALVEIDQYRQQNGLCGTDATQSFYSWDNLGNFLGFEMEWYIEHEDGTYCYRKHGLISEIKDWMVFLPFSGKYHVTCMVRDVTNFPNITRKREYIEVLKEKPDFTAFGRFVKNFDLEVEDMSWEDLEGSWDQGSQCPIKTTWEDLEHISWDSFLYSKYERQDFTDADTKSSEIIKIDETKNEITLFGRQFYDDLDTWKNYRYRNNIILYRDPDLVFGGEKLEIDSLQYKTLTIDGLFDIKTGTKISLYKYLKTSNFYIRDNRIRIYTQFYDNLQIGTSIKLIRENTAEGNQEKFYVIDDIDINLIHGYVDLYVDDDGSLDFKFDPLQRKDVTYNYSHWNYIELNSDHHLFKVIESNQNETQTVLRLEDNNQYLYYLKQEELSEYRVDIEVLSGYYVFNLDEDEYIRIDENENTILKLLPSEDLCKIDTTFDAFWADYDLDWAIRFGNSKKLTWDNIGEFVSWDDLQYQTWDTLEYFQEPLLGFRITDIVDKGIIKMNGVEYQIDLGVAPTTYDPKLNAFEYQKFFDTWKWNQAVKLLNNTGIELFDRFEYYNISNRYIQASSKYSGNLCLVQLEYTGGIQGSPDSYPKTFYTDWEEKYFNDHNNPALWNHLKRTYDENDNVFENSDNNENAIISYEHDVVGSFNFADTFATTKGAVIPKATTLFFVFDNEDFINETTVFKWEIWEETTNKLMIRSHYPYIIWTFLDAGKYTVKLWIENNVLDDVFIEKKSFIEVKENYEE